ncbi:MAG: LCP family protein [Christensenella sp.]|nr:LCP family protein [Christensenella sp.]
MNYKKGIRILTVVLVILIVSAGSVSYALYNTYTDIKANPISAFNTASGADELAAKEQDLQTPTEKITVDGTTYWKNPNTISILMLGIDWDGSEVKDKTGARSDMIMLCTVDMQNNKISFLSIPRDTRTKVHAVDKETGEIEDKTYTTKINHAYALGNLYDQEAAVKNTMLATEDLVELDGQLDIPVDYYISIDLEHLSDLAEALGGVEVTLDQDYPDIGSQGDTINLEGDAVRLYLQNRKQMDDGEMSRQRHEQDFMMAIARKVKKLGAVQAATKLYPQIAGKVIQTNLNLDQIVAMAGVLDKIGSIDDIAMETFEEKDDSWQYMDDPLVQSDTGLCYFIMDNDELMQKMLGLYYIPDGEQSA